MTAVEGFEPDIIAETWPCPSWCDSPRRDHREFDSWDLETGAQVRYHGRDFGLPTTMPDGLSVRLAAEDLLLPSGMTTTPALLKIDHVHECDECGRRQMSCEVVVDRQQLETLVAVLTAALKQLVGAVD